MILSKETILFYPGKLTHLKRYQSYFPRWTLVTIHQSPKVIICHSLGIESAILNHPGIPIIALDPSKLNLIHDAPIYAWVQDKRQDLITTYKTIYYSEPTHYPYMVKRIRDQIDRKLCDLLSKN